METWEGGLGGSRGVGGGIWGLGVDGGVRGWEGEQGGPGAGTGGFWGGCAGG